MKNLRDRNLSIIPIMAGLSLGVMNVALLSPALPAIKEYYHIAVSQSQFVVIIFLGGYAVSQLSFGAIAKKFGYQKSMFLGIMTGAIGSFICIYSSYSGSFFMLMTGRFIEGFGTSCGLALGFAIINELYIGKAVRDITTYGLMGLAFIAAFSSYIGGFLTSNYSWISCFYFLTACNILTAFSCFLLSRSLDAKKKSLFSNKRIICSYLLAFRNKKLILGSIIYGLFLAIIYLTIALLPFIGIRDLHLSPEKFGFFFLLSYLGYFIGTILTRFSTGRLNANASILLGMSITITGGFIFFISAFSLELNMSIIFSSIFISLIGIAFIFVNISSMAISSHRDKANGSAVFNFIYSLFALFSVVLPQFIDSKFELILPSVTIIATILGFCIYIKFAGLRIPYLKRMRNLLMVSEH
ncbi:MAG TPA: MFS transporter [Victivallales bacterium]|nr:MFS transporter [Victivallales bacterium]